MTFGQEKPISVPQMNFIRVTCKKNNLEMPMGVEYWTSKQASQFLDQFKPAYVPQGVPPQMQVPVEQVQQPNALWTKYQGHPQVQAPQFPDVRPQIQQQIAAEETPAKKSTIDHASLGMAMKLVYRRWLDEKKQPLGSIPDFNTEVQQTYKLVMFCKQEAEKSDAAPKGVN